MRWEFQRAQGRLPKFRNARKNGVSDTPKSPLQVSRYAKNRGFEHAKNALQSFANSSKPENDTLQFLTPQKCLQKSPKVTKQHPKFPYTPKSREFPNTQPKPHPRSPPDHTPKSAPSRHRAVKSAV